MRLVLGLTLAIVLVVGCGSAATAPSVASSSPPASATPSATPETTPSPSPTPSPTPTRAPTPTPVIENPAPPELIGSWQTTEGERITLSLTADRYSISRGPGSARGRIAVRGPEIELFGSDLCVGSGFYTWQIADGLLTLTAVGTPDPCGNRLDAVTGRSFGKQ